MNASLNNTSTAVARVKLLINGEWIDSQSGEWQDIVNPATQEILAQVPFATTDEVNAAVAAAHAAYRTWRDTPIGVRMR
ncbi:methylmalonate-semialdehyde dehydrogenase, partial [Pseudomonas syringae pv. actinidiae ICMP 18804]